MSLLFLYEAAIYPELHTSSETFCMILWGASILCVLAAYLTLLPFVSSTIILFPIRCGRGIRLRSLVRQIRKSCIVEDYEKGDGSARGARKWWIENLLKVEAYGWYGNQIEHTLVELEEEKPQDEKKVCTCEENLGMLLVDRIRV